LKKATSESLSMILGDLIFLYSIILTIKVIFFSFSEVVRYSLLLLVVLNLNLFNCQLLIRYFRLVETETENRKQKNRKTEKIEVALFSPPKTEPPKLKTEEPRPNPLTNPY
jgi:hypothetical protein